MKIVSLKSENVKRLQAVDITPEGPLVVISGKNEQGKSSVIDSIWLALDYKNASKDITRPIRDGQKGASITLDLGDLKVTRHWTDNDKSYLKVEDSRGAFKSPQAMLDKLIGKLSFDPLEFSRMKDKEQLDMLLSLVDIPLDLNQLDQEKAALYTERTNVNRDLKKLEAHFEQMNPPTDGIPEEEVSATTVLNELAKANEQVALNKSKRDSLENIQYLLKDAAKNIEDIKTQIANLQRQLEAVEERRKELLVSEGNLVSEVCGLIDPDISLYTKQLNELEETNRKIRDSKAYKKAEEILLGTKQVSQELTDRINALQKSKEDAIKAAKFPIDGLGFNENGVTFKGLPFKQECSSSQLKVSFAMAMTLNPDLRIIRVTDGNILDSSNLAIIEQMAKDNDYQVWIEKVDESGKVGIYIEDGLVAQNNG